MRLEKQSMRQEQIQIQFLKEIQISIFDICVQLQIQMQTNYEEKYK